MENIKKKKNHSIIPTVCEHCHKIFYSTYAAAKYCSAECRNAHKKLIMEWNEPVDFVKRSKESLNKIRDISDKASEIGLTYGQYVARGLDR